MNFPKCIINGIQLLNNNNSIIVKLGGILTKISVTRGIQRGDPNASVLFIAAIEPFLTHCQTCLSNPVIISGISSSVRVGVYADDCHIMIETENEIKLVENILEE